MVMEQIGRFYAGIEEKWYNFADALEKKGIPLTIYTNFLEEKGIPSLPFTIGTFILLVGVFYFFLIMNAGINPTLQLSVVDQVGNPVGGVQLNVSGPGFDSFTRNVGSSELLALAPMNVGSVVTIKASKENYSSTTQEIKISGETQPVKIVLETNFNHIVGQASFVDAETGTVITDITGATVTDALGRTYRGRVSDGKVVFANVPEGEELDILITTRNYEEYDNTISFSENEIPAIELMPILAGFAAKTDLLIEVRDETGEFAKNVLIKILNESGESIYEEDSETGTFQAQLDERKIVQIVVEKEDYLIFNSEPFTLTGDETQYTVNLRKGGEKLTITVVNQASTPLSNAFVALHNFEGKFVDSKETGIDGIAEFANLDPNLAYFVSGSRSGFLAERMNVEPAKTENVILRLEGISPANSVNAKVFVFESEVSPANNSTVSFFEITEDKELPLGLPPARTNITGLVEFKVKPNTNVLVKAQRGLMESEASFVPEIGKENEIRIILELPPTITRLNFVDETGKHQKGSVLITTESGDTLFDGKIESGKILFNSDNYKSVIVNVELEDGTTYTEKLLIGNEKELSLTVAGEKNSGAKPELEFLGIFNEQGQKVEAISKEKPYYLKFKTVFAPGTAKAGLHVRLGPDSVKYVDSQGMGILGFDAVTGNYFLGTTYTPEPLPGNESIDKQNSGGKESYNKLVELYYSEPNEIEIAKIKVQARQTFDAKEFDVHYRAWVETSGKIYREPQDKELGNERFSSVKSGLYAETQRTSVKVSESQVHCGENICADYVFVDESGLVFEENEFKPVLGKTYALQMNLNSGQTVTPSVLISTEKQEPKILFSSYQVQAFGAFPGGDAKRVELRVEGLRILANQERNVRAFFKTDNAGSSFVNVKIALGENITEKTFYFNVSKQKEFEIEVVPEKIFVGDNFVILLTDTETGSLIENATIQLETTKNELVRTVIGNGSIDRGAGGRYLVKEGMGIGEYRAIISAPEYKTIEYPLLILEEGLIELADVKISLAHSQSKSGVNAVLTNKSKFSLENVSIEIREDSQWPDELRLKLVTEPQKVGSNGKASFRIEAEYTGELEERAYGEADLIASGFIAGKFYSQTISRIRVSYNEQFDAECLAFDKKNIDVSMLGITGNQQTVSFRATNNCGKQLELKPEVSGEHSDKELRLQPSDIIIRAGEEKEFDVDVSNRINRYYSGPEERKFRVYYRSPQITKVLDIRILLTHPSFSLQTNDNIDVFLSPEEGSSKATGHGNLFIKNVGSRAIEAINISPGATQSNITLRVLPVGGLYGQGSQAVGLPHPTRGAATIFDILSLGSFTPAKTPYLEPQALAFSPTKRPVYGGLDVSTQQLRPGEQINPPMTIYAETSALKTLPREPQKRILEISGVIDGRRYPLKTVTVWLHASSPQCLKIFGANNKAFRSGDSSEGSISHNIDIKNDCGEEVRNISIEPENFGGNTFELVPLDTSFLRQGQRASFKLILKKGSDYSTLEGRTETLFVKGFLVRTQRFIKSAPISGIIIEIGQKAEAIGKATSPVAIPVCELPEEDGLAVKFPVIAKGNDCTTGYCDAEQFSEFLLEKLDNKVSDVQRKIRAGSGNTASFAGCDPTQPFCSFSSMGVISAPVYSYFQNDLLSKDVIKHVQDQGRYKSVQKMQPEFRQVDIEKLNASFTINQLMISEVIRGCGRYELSFDGAVQNVGGKLLENNIVLQVNVIGKSHTDECNPTKIQNIMNFLPQDEGLTTLDRKGTWLGLIQYESRNEGFKELASDLSNTLFGTETGRTTTGATGTNRLNLELGELEGNSIVKIETDQRSEETPQPRNSKVILTDLYAQSSEAYRNEIGKEAGKALAALKQSQIKGCIAQDESYLLLESAEDVGNTKITGPKGLPLTTAEFCSAYKVESSLIGGEIELEASTETDPVPGIENIVLKNSNGEELGNNGSNVYTTDNGVPIRLNENEETGQFEYEFQLCVDGKGPVVFEARDQNVALQAKSVKLPQGTEPKEIELLVCGINPTDLVKKASTVQPGTYYAVAMWEDGPDKLDAGFIDEAALSAYRKNESEFSARGNAQQVGVSRQLDGKKYAGVGTYFAGCTATSLIAGMWIKGPGDLVFDCVIPSVWATADIALDFGSFYDNTVKPFLSQIPLLETIIPGAETENNFEETLLGPGRAGLSARLVTQLLSDNATDGAQRLANVVVDEWNNAHLNDIVKNAPNETSRVDAFRNTLRRNTAEAAETALRNVKSRRITTPVTMRNNIVEVSKDAMQTGLTKTLSNRSVTNGLAQAAESAGIKVFTAGLGVATASLFASADVAKEVSKGTPEVLNGITFEDLTNKTISGQQREARRNALQVFKNNQSKIIDDTIAALQKDGRVGKELLSKPLEEGGGETLEGFIRKELQEKIGNSADSIDVRQIESGRYSKWQVNTKSSELTERIVNESLAKVSKNENVQNVLRESLSSQAQKELGQQLSKEFDEVVERIYPEEAGKLARNTARGFNLRHWTQIARTMGLGLFKGIGSQTVGYALWNLYWTNGPGATPLQGGVLVDGAFVKGAPVQIQITQHGKKKIEFVPIDETISPGLVETMNRDVQANKSILWQDEGIFKCSDYGETKAGCLLLVDPASQSVRQEFNETQAFVYSTNLDAINGASESYGVEENELLAVLLTDADTINGCSVPSKTWYFDLQSEEDRTGIINCVAGKMNAVNGNYGQLGYSVSQLNTISSLSKAFKEVNACS